jgi:hypothetical protein
MKALYFLIAVLLLCASVSAVPTTLAATNIGNNNFTLNGNAVAGTTGWFQWSFVTGREFAHLPNVTSNGGTITYTMKGTPVFGSTVYYFKACDPTGCGGELSFTTAAVTPLPTPMIGAYAMDAFATNITENGFDLPNAAWNAMRPYTAVTTDTIFYGMIFAMVFVGMWLRTRGTATANIFGMLCIGLFGISGGLLGGGILPAEFMAAGQAMMYLSLTGAVLAFTFK